MPAQADELATDKLIGQVLANRYQIEERLGEGAMGAVYRAKHVKVGRAFAVKVLHPRVLEDNKVQLRFEREAELAGRLRHPNVIGVVDVGETPDGLRYMVMDFAEGPDLASLLSEAPFTPERVILLTRQMLEGLYHAHEAGLIHRDFKPENVIIERDTHGQEVPRIVDFGIAILREGGDSSDAPGRLTTNGLVLGTPHYMAPEQAVADPIDHRIDLFALGIIIYEMLCGKLPFDGNGAEVARANLLLDPPPIATRVPYLQVDPLLEAFARRLLMKKRDQRPATAKVARDLLDLIAKDRDAAAAALGVPPEVARAPMTTQPSAPVRHQGDHEGTFPPPIREAGGAPQPPSMERAVATPAEVRAGVQPFSTQTTEPIRRRKPPVVLAAVIGLGVLAGGAAVVLMTKKDSPKAEPHAQVAETTPPAPAPTPPPVEAPPVETKPQVVDTPPVGSAAEPAPVATPGDTETLKAATAGKRTVAKKATTQKVQTPAVTPPVETKPAETKPAETKVEPKVETKPVETKPVDAAGLAKQYQRVGEQLKALERAKGADAASDLWSRYRLIRIVDAMSTQPKRDETTTLLSRLTTEITSRQR